MTRQEFIDLTAELNFNPHYLGKVQVIMSIGDWQLTWEDDEWTSTTDAHPDAKWFYFNGCGHTADELRSHVAGYIAGKVMAAKHWL